MTFNHLKYFIEVVNQKSFTKASEKLFISQSTISKALSSLEAELNTTLYEHGNREFILTQTGQYLYDFAKDVLGYWNVKEDELIEKIKMDNDKLKLGLYSAGTDWRKNTYNQVMAASLFKNATLEVIPLRYELQKIAYKNDLNIIGSDSHLKREDLLLEMAKNDITLYVTFSECAPMLPIESLEVGTICITGNNHHYFDNTKLYDYLVVEREDDVMAIYEKINYAVEHKDEIFKLYKEWKKSNDERTKKSVEEFLNM